MKKALVIWMAMCSSQGAWAQTRKDMDEGGAREYERRVNPQLEAIKPLGDLLARAGKLSEGNAILFNHILEQLQNLNTWRADAEELMFNPENIIHAPFEENKNENSNKVADAICPNRVLVCNPIGVPFEIIRQNVNQNFTVECADNNGGERVFANGKKAIVSTMYYVDCKYQNGHRTYNIRRKWDIGLSNTIVPVTPVRDAGDRLVIEYSGYSFSDFCTPCKRRK